MPKTVIRFRSLKHILALTGILFVGSMAIDLAPILVQASPDTSASLQTKQMGGRVPGRRRGGARRGDYPAASTELTALVPVTEVATQSLPETYVGGSTTAEYPTFWFYYSGNQIECDLQGSISNRWMLEIIFDASGQLL